MEESGMIMSRNGQTPRIDRSARIAPSAQIVGNVTIGAQCFIDHNVVVASSGPPIHIADHVLVFANSVIRSTGGVTRPGFPFEVEDHTLVAPLCAITGCHIGPLCYVATAAVILQGASLGQGARVGVGAIVHANARVAANARVGMRSFAVPSDTGAVITTDLAQARQLIQGSDFFDAAFGVDQDATSLHKEVIERLLDEVEQWHDDPAEAAS
jgi:carbonic anhydrase/acetyltransferase-like protein (isoleucine patch superfamily)